jgi:hypothetical protein
VTDPEPDPELNSEYDPEYDPEYNSICCPWLCVRSTGDGITPSTETWEVDSLPEAVLIAVAAVGVADCFMRFWYSRNSGFTGALVGAVAESVSSAVEAPEASGVIISGVPWAGITAGVSVGVS